MLSYASSRLTICTSYCLIIIISYLNKNALLFHILCLEIWWLTDFYSAPHAYRPGADISEASLDPVPANFPNLWRTQLLDSSGWNPLYLLMVAVPREFAKGVYDKGVPTCPLVTHIILMNLNIFESKHAFLLAVSKIMCPLLNNTNN